MDELGNFDTWCFIDKNQDMAVLEKTIEETYRVIRMRCHSEKWHPANVTVSLSARGEEIVHVTTVQVVKLEFIQRQQLQQSLSPNGGPPIRRV